ncbi:MAG: SUMF1/EgtB/PvdO family nonheme iron enzyme [Steroidobacteraceae bacterium]|nr:SUMF1/EgtB/PvdO family nonheme iron enzyme [Steroidobacteraceae bacterium]
MSAPEDAPARRGGAGKYVVVLLLVAAIAAGAFWYVKLRPATSAPASAEQAAPTAESYRSIQEFLAADDWSDEQIANFNSRWSTLPDDMRIAAIDEAWYQDFVGRVRSQVKERRALIATADRAGAVEGPLSALANSLGIDVSSPDAVVVPSRIRPSPPDGERSGTSRAAAVKPANSDASVPLTKNADAAPATVAPATPVTAPGTSKPAVAAAQPASAAKPALVNTADVPNPDKCRVELVGSRKPRCRDALNVGGFGPFLAMIPAGGFDMGSKQVAQEQPVHHVTIAKPFAVAEFETSQAEYQLFCTHTKRACQPQPWQGADFPVVRVSWQDARDYAAWLSEVSGKSYRLATEAEWEYAARGGSTALFPSGDALSQTDAVFSVTDKLGAPWPRSQKINANAFRLYHSIGNVREWVDDAWVPNFTGAPSDGSARAAGDAAQRVVRGGAYSDTAPKLRFTTREGVDATTRDPFTGFRVVREL